MKTEYYEQLNADLGFEFDLFAVEHGDWMQKNVPQGAVVVLQTEDPGFNAWARQIVEESRHLDDEPDRPIVLVRIRKLRPQRSRILQADAEVLMARPSSSRKISKRRSGHPVAGISPKRR